MRKKVVDYVLTIDHRGPEIRMTRKYKEGGREYSEERVYYTDGRAELSSRSRPGVDNPLARRQAHQENYSRPYRCSNEPSA